MLGHCERDIGDEQERFRGMPRRHYDVIAGFSRGWIREKESTLDDAAALTDMNWTSFVCFLVGGETGGASENCFSEILDGRIPTIVDHKATFGCPFWCRQVRG